MAPVFRILVLLAGSGVSVFSAVVTNCSQADLQAAIAQGGTVTFTCNGTINVNLIITNNVKLDGSGAEVTLSGYDSHRIFEVALSSWSSVIRRSRFEFNPPP